MSAKPIVLRERARRDVDEAVERYLAEARATATLASIDAPEDACAAWASTMQAVPPAMRVNWISLACARGSWGFPYLVSYVEREADIDVWRVLHAARDIPAWLPEPLED